MGNLFTDITAWDEEPSWYFAERVAEFLVALETGASDQRNKSTGAVKLVGDGFGVVHRHLRRQVLQI